MRAPAYQGIFPFKMMSCVSNKKYGLHRRRVNLHPWAIYTRLLSSLGISAAPNRASLVYKCVYSSNASVRPLDSKKPLIFWACRTEGNENGPFFTHFLAKTLHIFSQMASLHSSRIHALSTAGVLFPKLRIYSRDAQKCCVSWWCREMKLIKLMGPFARVALCINHFSPAASLKSVIIPNQESLFPRGGFLN